MEKEGCNDFKVQTIRGAEIIEIAEESSKKRKKAEERKEEMKT